MESLTQKWLRQNVQSYPNKDRVFADIDSALTRFPALRPKSDVYTFDDGRTQLLLCIHGLLPISFKQASYNIPIAVWITREYPKHPPISYVVPTNDMLIKPGRYIDPSGRCYIEYIQHWERKAEGCSLTAMLEYMQDEFSRQPPVYSKPKGFDRVQHGPTPSSSPKLPSTSTTPSSPPALPPKPITPAIFNTMSTPSQKNPGVVIPPPHPPPHHPTPPLPPSTTFSPHHPSSRPPQSAPPLPPHPPAAPTFLYQSGPPAAVSAPQYPPLPPDESRVRSILSAPAPAPAPPPPPPPPPIPSQGIRVTPHNPVPNQIPPTIEPTSIPAEPAKPVPNFLDEDSLEALPQLISRSEAPPPRPPNPVLLRLHAQVHEKVTSELSSLAQALALDAERLRAHQTDLLAGEPAIHDEMARLEAVRDVCLAVADKTRQVVQRAEANVSELRRKGDPEVDELVCSTNIVHNQLINLVADDNAIEDTIYHLHRALNTGRIDLERFLRSTRLLAEEQFMKRALIDKIQAGIPMAVSMGF